MVRSNCGWGNGMGNHVITNTTYLALLYQPYTKCPNIILQHNPLQISEHASDQHGTHTNSGYKI
ncbi:hypothetical protein PanWU01x14_114390 [Parasponia andersonii]|uniref:Uncharacterized protein n=1 Tax=Parasponia andersonii TaxID=3476 RepID=A0A2P5CXD4_PARAD|nr:hypothetical protein PanWU01x14_114390 [Parasponia andersonii]